MASSEVDDVAAGNQVDCTIDMLIAAASQQNTVGISLLILPCCVINICHYCCLYLQKQDPPVNIANSTPTQALS